MGYCGNCHLNSRELPSDGENPVLVLIQMICARCGNSEFDDSGTCLGCGFQPDDGKAAELPQDAGGSKFSGLIEMDFSRSSETAPAENEELPEWRKQLTKRLMEIKQKRELSASTAPAIGESQPEQKTSAPAAALAQPIMPGPSPKVSHRPSKPSQPDAPSPGGLKDWEQATVQRRQSALPLFEPPALTPPESKERRPEATPASSISNPGQIKNLIDNAVMNRGAARGPGAQVLGPRREAESALYQEKLILLSRTLAGLVDLIIIFLCGSACILAADVFAGIDVIDWVSLVDYLALFLATFFVYSIFFLGTTNQTIGMMITELKVVALDGKRPGIKKVLTRCSAFLLALLGVGIGLLWGCFDRKNRCLHDWLSETMVVRID